jgi:glycerol kinase
MSQYIIAIDQGTTSCRALLINDQGKIEGVAQKEFTQHFPIAGWVEHDANEIWQTQRSMIEAVISKNDINVSAIKAIGITNQRETTVIWDRHTGKPIHNAIVWQDRRTSDICESLKASGYEDYVRQNTGLVLDAYFSGTKVKWILDNVPGARAKAENGELCFGTIDSWLIWNLTEGRNHLTDFTNASRTMMYNIITKSWDEKMLTILGVPNKILPEVQDSSSHFGFFEFKGIKIPICGVAGDQQAALFGQACFELGMAKNTYGTGCFMLMNVGDKPVHSKSGMLTTLACNALGKASYALEGSVFVAGAGVQWLRDGLHFIKSAAETEEICMSLADDYDVTVIPAFAGLGAPYWDMYARGAIFGLTRGTTDKHIVKATVDAIAFQTKDIIYAMQSDMGATLKELKVDGGAVANNYLMQFQANILGVPVERPSIIESTAMGAAYLAGMYIGMWDAAKIIKNREVDRRFEPLFNVAKIDELYGKWQWAIQRTRT